MDRFLEKTVAITGVGQSEVGRPSTLSAMRLTADACLEAIADAGLTPADIDGVSCWPGDNSAGGSFSPVGGPAASEMLGLKVNWYGGGYEGPGPLSGVINGAMAIATGLARHVLVFRTITESRARAGNKMATSLTEKAAGRDGSPMFKWYTPFNAMSAVNLIAMYAQRHFHDFGTTSEQLGDIAITLRRHAQLNPKAVMRKPMSMDDYLNSKMISTPLRMLDCDIHCDASTAMILSRREEARDMTNPVIGIEAIGSALHQPNSWDQIDLTAMATADVGRMLWSRTDIRPADVDMAQLYDGFTILTLMWLEGLQFCERGEGGPFVEGGEQIALTGRLPLNTNGGQLSGGRTHGLGYLHEACSQIWGRCGPRQLVRHQTAVVAAGGGPLGGAILLRRE